MQSRPTSLTSLCPLQTTYKGKSSFQTYSDYLRWESFLRQQLQTFPEGSALRRGFQTCEHWKQIFMEIIGGCERTPSTRPGGGQPHRGSYPHREDSVVCLQLFCYPKSWVRTPVNCHAVALDERPECEFSPAACICLCVILNLATRASEMALLINALAVHAWWPESIPQSHDGRK